MAAKHSKLTAEFVRELFSYDTATGVLRWKMAHQGTIVGSLCGTPHAVDARRKVSVRGEIHKTARLVWLYVTGSWPDNDIDHINGDPSDDRFENLRDVPHKKNIQNQVRPQKSNLSSGFLGVTLRREGKWTARLWVDGKNLFLGDFTSPEAAHDAYLAAKRKLHAGCTI